MAITIQLRRGTASAWTAADTVLAAGELAIETDTNQFKIGDGTTPWTELAYGGLQGEPGLTEGEAIMIRDTMTAGGTITAGDAVWVDSAGKIQKGIGSVSIGSPTESAVAASDTKLMTVWLTATTFIMVRLNAGATVIYARCGVVSGNAITLGDEVTVGAFSGTMFYGVIRLSDTTFVIYYDVDTAKYPGVRCGSVSGTTITLGTALQIQAAGATSIPMAGNIQRLDDTHFVTAFHQAETKMRMNAYSVSGTTITKGSDSDITITSGKYSASMCTLDATHFVIPQVVDATNSKVICCSVSGTTITQGTAASVSTADFFNTAASYVLPLSSTSFAIAYTLGGSNTTLKIAKGTVSGTDITMESSVTCGTAITALSASNILRLGSISSTLFAVWVHADKFLLTVDCTSNPLSIVETKNLTTTAVYAYPGPGNTWLAIKTLSGSPYTMTYTTYTIGVSGATLLNSTVIFTGVSNPGHTQDFASTNTTGTKMIHVFAASTGPANYTCPAICSIISTTGGTLKAGIAVESASLDESCDVALQAASLDLWTGLTIGATYYVCADGTLSTTAQTINGVSSRLGAAATTSKILINTAATDPKQLY